MVADRPARESSSRSNPRHPAAQPTACSLPTCVGLLQTTHVLALVTTALSGISCAETLIYMVQASNRQVIGWHPSFAGRSLPPLKLG